MSYRKAWKRSPGASFLRPLDRLFLIDITFSNSRGWLLYKINAANTEIDDHKALHKYFNHEICLNVK